MSSSFPLFPNFPLELRRVIWALAVPDAEAEVCIVWPLVINSYPTQREQPALPFTVDTAWPAVFHTCRESREAVLSSGSLRLRYSPSAGIAVPFRLFDPAIDTLYWGHWQCDAMHSVLTNGSDSPENAAFADLGRCLRHVAVEVSASYPHKFLAEIIRQRAVYLRTLSLVLPAITSSADAHANRHPTHTPFLPPSRRCRIRDVPDEVVQRSVLTDVPFAPAQFGRTMPLNAYLEHRRADMDRHVRRFNVWGDRGSAWNDEDKSFSGVQIKVQTFVEYDGTHGQQQQQQHRWVEVCGQRKLDGSSPLYLPPSQRRDPVKYRVLEDDCIPAPFQPSAGYEVEILTGNSSL